eukprot:108800-Chlamydomonas_euryale.AAC.1
MVQRPAQLRAELSAELPVVWRLTCTAACSGLHRGLEPGEGVQYAAGSGCMQAHASMHPVRPLLCLPVCLVSKPSERQKAFDNAQSLPPPKASTQMHAPLTRPPHKCMRP